MTPVLQTQAMDLYIYYRVASANGQELCGRVVAMQRSLSHDYGIVGSLKRRPEEQDGQQTWMEVYQAVPDGFETALERAIAQAGLTYLIDGPRHTEYFVDVSSCA